MKTVYLLQSISHPEQRYVGSTSNVRQGIAEHNAGRSPHTAKYCPWKLVAGIAFSDDQKALEFERYLKAGSGHAFANKHLG